MVKSTGTCDAPWRGKELSVRFAFKTANQNTTWSDVLAVWKEGDGIERFESGWNFDHFYPIAGDRPVPAWRDGRCWPPSLRRQPGSG